MAYNNNVKLTGNLGGEAKIIEGENKTFAALRLATTDTYKDKETDEWKDKATIWHDVIVFNPALIEEVKAYKKGVRLEIDGSLSYREFLVSINGKEVTKREASILAHKIEQAPLVKKDKA
ncbi:MAG: single-stranded DNA-binding protein [Bacteroidota bacterium]